LEIEETISEVREVDEVIAAFEFYVNTPYAI
jgi:hypothetical protein